MKILIAHNFYQHRGGEDMVVENEIRMLQEQGAEVITYFRHNDEIQSSGLLDKAKMLFKTTWSEESYLQVRQMLKKEQPDVCHVHNFFPLITPSIYQACRDEQVPVIQTLHNFRLSCLNAMFIRNGKVCEDCLTQGISLGVKRKCYRDSYLQSYAVARMLTQHEKKNTWNTQVDRFLCFTEFARQKFIQAGIQAEKLLIKPNFVDLPEIEAKAPKKPSVLFIGRADLSKGIRVFAEASYQFPDHQFMVIGKNTSDFDFGAYPQITYLGEMPHQEAMGHLKAADALVFPSLCYEGMPMTILEAFALKTPVVASNLGAMQSIVQSHDNGLLFEPDNRDELVRSLNQLLPDENLQNKLKEGGYSTYQNLYSQQANARLLMDYYKQLMT